MMLKNLLTILVVGSGLVFGQAPDYKDIRNTPEKYGRTYGMRCDGTTNDSTAFAATLNALPANGGKVVLPPGVCKINSTLTIGTGSGVTQSTKNNITIEGQGASGNNNSFPSATKILWGGTGGTVVKIQGPITRVSLKNLTIDGNNQAAILVDELACNSCTFNNMTLQGVGVNGWAIRMDALADYNANTMANSWKDINISARSSGASCLDIGPTYLDFNAGNFDNVFENFYCTYANDVATSYGVRLGWADNNTFVKSRFGVYDYNGLGSAIKHVKQTPNWPGLPSENTFLHTPIGCGSCVGITGDSGDGIGTVFYGYQVGDSSGLGTAKGVRGWLHNGDFFDTSERLAAQHRFKVYHRTAPAILDILGFSGSAGTGTISTSGINVVGSGTLFTSELSVGRTIAVNSNVFRTVTAITDNTHATINAAFDSDVPAGSSFLYQIGAYGQIFADSDLNINLQSPGNIKFKNAGTEIARLDQYGNAYTKGGVYPSDNNVQIRSGSGSPEGVVTGQIGDVWMRTNGGPCTSLYVKESGPNTNIGWLPYVSSACNSGGGGGGGTLATVSVSGTINGTNPTFTIPTNNSLLLLYVNGVLQQSGTHYTRSTTTITFDSSWIPATGDIITAYGWN